MDKKQARLGMNPSTAAHRLRADVLFSLVAQLGHVCFRCGGDLTRDTFSLEHKEPWLNSADPVGLFFDLNNIAFSHQACNYAHGKKGPLRKYTEEEAALRVKDAKRKHWTPEKRRAHYLKTGN